MYPYFFNFTHLDKRHDSETGTVNVNFQFLNADVAEKGFSFVNLMCLVKTRSKYLTA